jgi:hypothetical protein
MRWIGFSNGQYRRARRLVTPHLPVALSSGAGPRYGRVVGQRSWNKLMGGAVGQPRIDRTLAVIVILGGSAIPGGRRLAAQDYPPIWQETPEALEYYAALSPAERSDLYAKVLARIRDMTTDVWGSPEDWARICGTTTAEQRVLLNLNVTFYGDSAATARRLPEPLLAQASAQGWVDVIEGMAESGDVPALGPMTIAVSLPEPITDGVLVQVLLRHPPPCKLVRRGFFAILGVTLHLRDGIWKFDSWKTMVIS